MRSAILVAVVLAAISHTLAGVFPLVSSPVTKNMGAFIGAAKIYSASAGVLVIVALASRRYRNSVSRALRHFLEESEPHYLRKSLCCFAIAGCCFYLGMTASQDLGAFFFLTRMDWLLQALIGALILREHWTKPMLMLTVTAFAGAVCINFDRFAGWESFVFALGFVVFSLLAHIQVKAMLDSQQQVTPASYLAIRTFLIMIVLGIGAFFSLPPSETPAEMPQVSLLAVAAALILLALFWLRLAAMARMALGWVAALNPWQSVTFAVISLALGEEMSLWWWSGVGVIVAAEVAFALIVILKAPSPKPAPASAAQIALA